MFTRVFVDINEGAEDCEKEMATALEDFRVDRARDVILLNLKSLSHQNPNTYFSLGSLREVIIQYIINLDHPVGMDIVNKTRKAFSKSHLARILDSDLSSEVVSIKACCSGTTETAYSQVLPLLKLNKS